MSVDPYALCPCGSGKKLKFCCNDLAGEIEKIHRMIEGDQPKAALQHVEQSLRKHPGRASLLDLKAVVEFTLERFDEAAGTIDTFLAKDVRNPTAHAHAAMLACVKDELGDAVGRLQDALELVAEDMPLRVLEAIGAVGHGLLLAGDVVAARAHLWLYQGIIGRKDTRAMQLLLRLNQSAGLPVLLRDNLFLREVPEGHACDHDHYVAQVLASQGKWRQAAAVLDALVERHPELDALVYNAAVVHGWLGDRRTFAQKLHRFALMDVPLDDAVEAEAIAQLLDPDIREEFIDSMRVAFPVLDGEALTARLSESKRVVKTHDSFTGNDAGPPPTAEYLLLDREMPPSGKELARQEVPVLIAVVGVFGRQTDREPRLEIVAVAGAEYDAAIAAISNIAGDALGEPGAPDTVGQLPALDVVLGWNWYFPLDTPAQLSVQLRREERRDRLIHRWPETGRPALGGKSPREALADSAMRIPVMASVLILEQGSSNADHPQTIDQLRELLALPKPEPIDPTAEGFEPERLPLVRFGRVTLEKLDDEDLAGMHRRGIMAGAKQAIEVTGRELLRRPSVAEKVRPDDIYARLIHQEEDPAMALDLVDEASSRTRQAGGSIAKWEVLRLELLLESDRGEEAVQLLDHLKENHFDEPGIADRVFQILQEIGALTGPPDPVAALQNAQLGGPTEPALSSAIWTPEGAAAAGGEKKLWVPS